eukprot:357113-Chlamydomonas_euryale.AAC.2
MDFIVSLPESKLYATDPRGYDAVLVVVDRLMNLVTLIPTYTDANAEDTAYAFFANVVTRFGVPKEIVIDRQSLFVGNFQKELHETLGIKGCATTAYHPQSDGQTERNNRVIGDMLCNLVGYERQHDWARFLPAAEFANNNTFHASTGSTPFRQAYGQDPRMPPQWSPLTVGCARIATYQPPPPFLLDGEEQVYMVERNMSHCDTPRSCKRRAKDPREYLVKWSGYDESEATWEPKTNVRILDAFESYWRANAPMHHVAVGRLASLGAVRARQHRPSSLAQCSCTLLALIVAGETGKRVACSVQNGHKVHVLCLAWSSSKFLTSVLKLELLCLVLSAVGGNVQM